MGVGGASPTAGASCATCLRKFTVHFRRPYNIGRATNRYNGEFGFDWLRDEYIYPIQKIDENKKTVLVDNSNIAIHKLKKSIQIIW